MVLVVSCTVFAGDKGPADVDAQRLLNADNEPGAWMSYGRDYSEQRFSQLDEVSTKTVD
jgi:glucose dehydrogenase